MGQTLQCIRHGYRTRYNNLPDASSYEDGHQLQDSPNEQLQIKELQRAVHHWFECCHLLPECRQASAWQIGQITNQPKERERNCTTSIQPAWLMRTDLCSCLGHLQNGCEAMANSLLVLMPQRHGAFSILKQIGILSPDGTKARAVKTVMKLIANSLSVANASRLLHFPQVTTVQEQIYVSSGDPHIGSVCL